MFSLKNVISEINRLSIVLLTENIAVDIQPAITRELSFKHLSTITSANSPLSLSDTFCGKFASLPDYYQLLTKRYYNWLLFDGSIIHFGLVFQNNILIKHRYLYYPCPIDFNVVDMISDVISVDDIQSIIDKYLREEASNILLNLGNINNPDITSYIKLSSPLRFDFDIYAQNEGHPASHFTVDCEDCRIPVFGPLSIGHFIRTIFHNFYPDIWEAHEIINQWNSEINDRTISETECKDMYFESNLR